MNKRYFLSIIVTIIAIMAHTLSMMARPYCDVRQFSIVDGLAANTISDMKQAPDGLMWFSTWNGLSYYDGYSFYTFRDVPGGEDVLSTNRIIDIYPTTRNNVWCVSSDRKIYLYSTHSCKFLNSEKSINEQFGINLKVNKLYPIKKGSTWITTQNGNYITEDEALAIALARVNLNADQISGLEIELTEDDGRMVYEIEFRSGGAEYEFTVNAVTGAVIDMEIDD